jgi:hypothetical protein
MDPKVEPKPKKRRKRRKPSLADLGRFVQQYARKAHRGMDPNDRQYSRKVEKLVKAMKPEELDQILRDDA